MKILAIESFSVTPHFETAIEIAVNHKLQGDEVYFVFFKSFYDLQRLPGHLNFGLFKNLQWLKNDNNRVNIILNKLNKFKIKTEIVQSKNLFIFIKALKYCLFHPLSINKIKNYDFDKANLGVGAASTYISRCGHQTPEIYFWSLTIKKLLFEAAITYQNTSILLKNISPDIVYTFNGRFTNENAIVQACIINKIKIKLHERGSTFEKFDIFDYPLHSFTNYEKKIQNHWNSPIPIRDKEIIAKDFFEKKRRGDDMNWMSYSNHFTNEFDLPITAKKKVVYFSSSDDEMASIYITENQPVFRSQRECINYLIDFFSKRNDYLFIIRNHPNLSSKHKKDQLFWDNLAGENLILLKSTSKINSFDVVDYSDVVITYSSTIGIESTYWGKPSILLGLAYYRFLNCTYNPENIEEFEFLLGQDLKGKNIESCFPYGYFYNSFGTYYKFYKPLNFFDGDLLID